ncbi:hypothetical protein G9A89_021070 [Geosiphon pyriformis]|nr:hypothetical protein G9A89_021070 [Geosiphon pyriformis]
MFKYHICMYIPGDFLARGVEPRRAYKIKVFFWLRLWTPNEAIFHDILSTSAGTVLRKTCLHPRLKRCCFCISLRTGTIVIALLTAILSTANAFGSFTAHSYGVYYISNTVCLLLGIGYTIKALVSYGGLVGAIVKSEKLVRIFSIFITVMALLTAVIAISELVYLFQNHGTLKSLCVDKLHEQLANGVDYDPSSSWVRPWKRQLTGQQPNNDNGQGLQQQQNNSSQTQSNSGNGGTSSQSNNVTSDSSLSIGSHPTVPLNNATDPNNRNITTPQDEKTIDETCVKFIRLYTVILTVSEILTVAFSLYFASVVSRYAKRLKQTANYYKTKNSIADETRATAPSGASPLSRLSAESDGSTELNDEKKLPRGIHTESERKFGKNLFTLFLLSLFVQVISSNTLLFVIIKLVGASASGSGSLLAGLRSHSAFSVIVNSLAGPLSAKMLQATGIRHNRSWGSKMENKKSSVSKVLDVENLKGTVARKMSYIDSNTSEMDDMMDNATSKKTQTRTYILSFVNVSNDNNKLVLLVPKFVGSNWLLSTELYALEKQSFKPVKLFALNIELSAVLEKINSDKLIIIKKIFYQIYDFKETSTLLKFLGIIKFSFTSERSLKKTRDLAVNEKILVNDNIRQVNKHSDQEIIVKKISVNLSKLAVESVFSKFGKIVLIKIQLIGLWQKALVEFESSEIADLVTAKWSVLMEKDSICVAKAVDDKQIGKTCFIGCNPAMYVHNRCAVICFSDETSKLAAIGSLPVFKGVNLHWTGLSLVVTPQDQICLVNIYKKKQASIAHPVLANVGFSLEIKPSLPVVNEINDRFATLECSLANLVEQVDKLAKRLDVLGPTVFQPSPEYQGADVVMNKSLGASTDSVSVVRAMSFDMFLVSKLENSMKCLMETVLGLLAKVDNLVWKVATCNVKRMNNPAKQNDIVRWHKNINNLVLIFTETKLKEKICPWIANKFSGVRVFISGLNSGYLGSGVAIVMNNSLTRHVCKVSKVPGHLISIKLLFRNRLSADIINSLIAKAANKSTFVILGGDFNENGSHKCASFKKCFSLGLVNLLAESSVAKMSMWKNSRGVVKTINYVFVSSNLVNVILCCDVLDVDKHFDMDHYVVSVSGEFKNAMVANAAMFSNGFAISKRYLDLDTMWNTVHKMVSLLANEYVNNKAFFKVINTVSYEDLVHVVKDLPEDKAAVKKQESLCRYYIDSRFVAKTGRLENQGGLTLFLAAGVFVDNTIWVGSSQAATQYILNIASDFFSINNISVNNKKTVVISINRRVSEASLSISGSPILIACKEESHKYLEIYLSSEDLFKPSLMKTYLDVRFFVNLVLRKAISDKQFLYLVSAILQPIDTLIRKNLRLKTELPKDFSNEAFYHPSLYGLKSFKQLQTKCKVASVLNFSNAGELLGRLFVHRSLDLQVLSWSPIHPLCHLVRLHISPVNNFLAGVVKVFLDCNMSLGNFSHTAFHFSGGTPMSSVLGNCLFYEVLHSLKRSRVAFVKQLYTKKDLKRLNPRGSVPHWFNLVCEFLVHSLYVGLPVTELKLQDVGGSDDIFCLKQSFITSNLCVIEIYTDGSLKNFGIQKMECGAAAYFLNVDQGIGIRIGELVSSTLAELQAIVLALECVSFHSSVIIYSDSQAVLDACAAESVLAFPDFRNCCWLKWHGIFNLIKRKGLGVSWHKVKRHSDIADNERADKLADSAVSLNLVLPVLVKEMFIKAGGMVVSGNIWHFTKDIFKSAGPDSAVIGKDMIGDVDWVHTTLVWHPNLHMAAGFTNRSMAGMHSYFLKTLHHRLPVAVRKCLYNKSYPSVLCLYYGEMESSDHSFICAFDSGILQMLSLSISNDVLYTTLDKDFLFKDWYLEAVSVLDDTKAKYRAFIEKCGLILHDGSAFPVTWGLLSSLLAGVTPISNIMFKKKASKVAFHGPAGGFFFQKKKVILKNVKHSDNERDIFLNKSGPINNVYSDVKSLSGDNNSVSMSNANSRSLLDSAATILKIKQINTGAVFGSPLSSPNFSVMS